MFILITASLFVTAGLSEPAAPDGSCRRSFPVNSDMASGLEQEPVERQSSQAHK